jgi:hypothetical protein
VHRRTCVRIMKVFMVGVKITPIIVDVLLGVVLNEVHGALSQSLPQDVRCDIDDDHCQCDC